MSTVRRIVAPAEYVGGNAENNYTLDQLCQAFGGLVHEMDMPELRDFLMQEIGEIVSGRN